MTISSDTALVLFSGGQDSTVCLAWALERYARVETIGFDYGQRHRRELDFAAEAARRLGVPQHLIDIGPIGAHLTGSALRE